MKSFFRTLALAAATACCSNLCAQSFTEDGIHYDISDAEQRTLTVVRGDGDYVGDVTIPARVDHDGVTYTVTALHDQAFFQCADLAAITIPATVTDLGRYSFSQCTSLAQVSLPQGIETIPEGCFVYCSSLTSVELPESVSEIEGYGFGYCSSLSQLNLSDRITYLGDMALIGTALPSFSLPASLARVPKYIVALNTALTSVTLHDGVTSIGECAFQGDPLLTAITLPASVTEIEASAFAQCTSLTSVTVPDGVTAIPARCFYNDMALQKVVLGKGVTSIGTDAFARYKTDKPQLKDVYLAAEQVVSGGDSFIDAACAQATLHVPVSLLDSYKANNAWKRFSCIVAIADGELTAVESVSVQPANDATPYYNIGGQRVNANTKGIVIHGGKKHLTTENN